MQKKLEAEAQGYERLLEAYNENPDLARFLKGNEAKLWHTQAEQQAAALQNLNPTYHVWQSGGGSADPDPIMAMAARVLPVAEMVGSKYGLKIPDALNGLCSSENAVSKQ